MTDKHTPESWTVIDDDPDKTTDPDDRYYADWISIRSVDDKEVARVGYRCCRHGVELTNGDTEHRAANARRIVACVTACEGIHPAAVPKLLEACRDLLDAFWDMSPLEYAKSRNLDGMSDAEGEVIKGRARTAIANAEGGA